MKTNREKMISVDDDDEDEMCASKSCSRPSGDEVGWVQCDACELWFHLVCIGLSSEKAEALDSYKCTLCVSLVVNISNTKGPSPESPDSVNVDVDSTTPCGNSPCASPPRASPPQLAADERTSKVEPESNNPQTLAVPMDTDITSAPVENRENSVVQVNVEL